jgi:hypothetical protein
MSEKTMILMQSDLHQKILGAKIGSKVKKTPKRRKNGKERK